MSFVSSEVSGPAAEIYGEFRREQGGQAPPLTTQT